MALADANSCDAVGLLLSCLGIKAKAVKLLSVLEAVEEKVTSRGHNGANDCEPTLCSWN